MEETYNMLRSEAMEALKKQDITSSTVLTILGLTSTFSTIYDNIAFLVLILFIAAVLLAQLQQQRNVVHYIASYLRRLEEEMPVNEIRWEQHLHIFKSSKFSELSGPKFSRKYSQFSVRFAILLRNGACLGLATFIAFQLIMLLSAEFTALEVWQNNITFYFLITASVIGGCCYLACIFFSVSTATDHGLKESYYDRWCSIFNENPIKQPSSLPRQASDVCQPNRSRPPKTVTPKLRARIKTKGNMHCVMRSRTKQ